MIQKFSQQFDYYVHRLTIYMSNRVIDSIHFPQLLCFSPKQVMEYLDDYFKRSCNIIGGSDVDHGLCLLCIQCFEVYAN